VDNGYAPPISLAVGNGKQQPPISSGNGSGFNFMSQTEAAKPNGSAFGFIAGSDLVGDGSSRTSSSDRSSAPKPPSVVADDFLLKQLSVDASDFADMWESANDESYVIAFCW